MLSMRAPQTGSPRHRLPARLRGRHGDAQGAVSRWAPTASASTADGPALSFHGPFAHVDLLAWVQTQLLERSAVVVRIVVSSPAAPSTESKTNFGTRRGAILRKSATVNGSAMVCLLPR